MSRLALLAFIAVATLAKIAHAREMPPEPDPTSEAVLDKVIKLGVAQFEPTVDSWWSKAECIERVCKYIEAAGKANVKLLTFPEGAVSGYPWFNWWATTFQMSANEVIMEEFILNSIELGTGDLDPILECIKKARVNVLLPINERDNEGSRAAVFNTGIFIDLNGKIVARHRKVLPSFTERFWWTQGDGSDILVVDLPEVGRVCNLMCWENYLVLARYTLYAQGCEFLLAPTQDIGPVWAALVKTMAREGRMYVIATGQMFKPEVVAQTRLAKKSSDAGSSWVDLMLKDYAKISANKDTKGYMMDGGSQIANPDGQTIAGPVYSGCSFCVDVKTGPPMHSIEWAQKGCQGMDGKLYGATGDCEYISIPGLAPTEFIMSALGSRSTVLRKKTYQDNVGNYATKTIWNVTWNNKVGNYLYTTQDKPVSAPGVTSDGLTDVDGIHK